MADEGATTVTLDDIATTAGRVVPPGTPFTAREIAADLGCVRRTAYAKLMRLAADGRLETKKVGARGRVWWLPRDERGAEERARRPEGEHELERYRAIVEAAGDAIYVVDDDQRFTMVNRAAVELSGYPRERIIGAPVADFIGDSSAARADRLAGALSSDDREVATAEFTLRTADGRAVPVEVRFSHLPTADGSIERVGIARDISDRKARERTLEAQREHLAALDHLNGVVHEITDAAIEQSTREEIERIVCEALAATDSYAFAWIGDVDSGTDTIRLRTEAGVTGYLDGITIPFDPDDPRGNGPTTTAIRTREMQVVTDSETDYEIAEWREHAKRHGFRSSAAIPIVHDGICYGVLNVYAPRSAAFEGEERDVIGRLGEVVGHAIAAVDRKRALTSDHVHELDFGIPDVFAALDIPATAADRITLDQTVPIGGGEFLVYGTATREDMAVVDAIVDTLPNWNGVRVIGEGFDRTTFELKLSESSVLSSAAARGGYVEGAWIEDGDFHMTIQIPQGADVRQFIDAILDAYPVAEVRAQRQVMRTGDSSNQIVSAGDGRLTDRQRTALETAYFAGFFEWPRESTGEEVADTLGISPPTFSQHLRVAEKKVFGALFDRTLAAE